MITSMVMMNTSSARSPLVGRMALSCFSLRLDIASNLLPFHQNSDMPDTRFAMKLEVSSMMKLMRFVNRSTAVE